MPTQQAFAKKPKGIKKGVWPFSGARHLLNRFLYCELFFFFTLNLIDQGIQCTVK
jgi:hypothetical protein